MLYEVIDLGSRNGTYLNGKRISVSKQESEPCELEHDSILQLGSTKLLCHVHAGYETCDHCEPGLVQKDLINEMPVPAPISVGYKSEVKRIKNKFGIMGDNIQSASQVAEGYQDRAQTRRKHVGSSTDSEKTEQSSLDK